MVNHVVSECSKGFYKTGGKDDPLEILPILP